MTPHVREDNRISDLFALATEEIELLHKALDDQKTTADGLLATADQEMERLKAELLREHAQVAHLKERVNGLKGKLKHAAGSDADKSPIPDTLDEFEDWCARVLSGAVFVLNRAYREIKKSD